MREPHGSLTSKSAESADVRRAGSVALLLSPPLARGLPSVMAVGKPPEESGLAAWRDSEESGGSGELGVVNGEPSEPSGCITREGRWIVRVGPERERDGEAFNDCPDMGTRALDPKARGDSGDSGDDEVLPHVGTGTERAFGPT